MSVQDQLSAAKEKKKIAALKYGQDLCFEHPIRLMGMGLSGAVEWINDGQLYTSPGLSAWLYTVNVDCSLFDGYTRVPFTITPFIEHDFPAPAIDPGEFQLYQNGPLKKTWEIFQRLQSYGFGSSGPVVGTFVRKHYYRNTTSDPWTLDTTETFDVKGTFLTYISGGGKASMHGNDSTTPATISCTLYIEASYLGSAEFPDLDDYADGIERMPWGFPWASETAAFLSKFDDRIAYLNGLRGGGFSGSCSLSLDFA